jgi:hypothetical protein
VATVTDAAKPRLSPERVRAAGDEALAIFEDDEWHLEDNAAVDDDSHVAHLQGRIDELLEHFPHLTSTFDYGWVRDRRSYRYGVEMLLQYHLLGLIADIDPAHPRLAGHSPFVVRVAVGREFVSSSMPAGDINLLVISRGFMEFLKYFLELSLDLLELEARLPPAAEEPGLRWGADRIEEIFGSFHAETNAVFQHFALQAFELSMEARPSGGAGISERLLAGPAAQALSYSGTESFVVAHEMAHLLEGHSSARKLHQEVNADRAAVSLCIASVGADNRTGSNWSHVSLYVGVPAFFAVGRLYLQIGASVDRVTGHPPRVDYAEAQTEIEAREIFVDRAFADFGIPVDLLEENRSKIRGLAGWAGEWVDLVGRSADGKQ